MLSKKPVADAGRSTRSHTPTCVPGRRGAARTGDLLPAQRFGVHALRERAPAATAYPARPAGMSALVGLVLAAIETGPEVLPCDRLETDGARWMERGDQGRRLADARDPDRGPERADQLGQCRRQRVPISRAADVPTPASRSGSSRARLPRRPGESSAPRRRAARRRASRPARAPRGRALVVLVPDVGEVCSGDAHGAGPGTSRGSIGPCRRQPTRSSQLAAGTTGSGSAPRAAPSGTAPGRQPSKRMPLE